MVKLTIRPLVYFLLCKNEFGGMYKLAHIRKRGKTYTYAIDIGHDPLTGKRKQISKGGFIKKKDAEAAARSILSIGLKTITEIGLNKRLQLIVNTL